MPLPAALIAAIPGAAKAGGGFLQGHWNRKQARKNLDKTINANRELAQYAYQQDLEQWNRANEYNTPKAQMERYKEAGLNPHLIYGQGTPGNTQVGSPKYNPPSEDYSSVPAPQIPQLGEGLGAYLGTKLQMAQIDNVKANTDNVNARTATEFWNSGLKEHELETMRPYQAGILGNQAEASNYLKSQAKSKTDKDAAEAKRADVLQRLEQMRFDYEKSTGIAPGDMAWLRIVIKALPSMGISSKTVMEIIGPKMYNQIFNTKDY